MIQIANALLQSALTLLLAVQGPNVDAATRQHAVTVANQAISYATTVIAAEQARTTNPAASARSYLAGPLYGNGVYAEKAATTTVAVASLAKLMSAVVAMEEYPLTEPVTVSRESIVFTSTPRLKPGQRVSTLDMLRLSLLESSNEAALSLSDHRGRAAFVARMNGTAAKIGMGSSHFADAAGISAENRSSAKDLVLLARYIEERHPLIWKITKGEVAAHDPAFTHLKNFNVFEKDPKFIGGKVGLTIAAKETILSVFAPPPGKTSPEIVIVLGSDDRARDAASLRNLFLGK